MTSVLWHESMKSSIRKTLTPKRLVSLTNLIHSSAMTTGGKLHAVWQKWTTEQKVNKKNSKSTNTNSSIFIKAFTLYC